MERALLKEAPVGPKALRPGCLVAWVRRPVVGMEEPKEKEIRGSENLLGH